jgi:hypothetical protein
MSLCLALLLTIVAINRWHGWKPFTHPFQMQGNQWLKRLSIIHSRRRRSNPRSIVGAQLPGIRASGTRRRRCLHLRCATAGPDRGFPTARRRRTHITK